MGLDSEHLGKNNCRPRYSQIGALKVQVSFRTSSCPRQCKQMYLVYSITVPTFTEFPIFKKFCNNTLKTLQSHQDIFVRIIFLSIKMLFGLLRNSGYVFWNYLQMFRQATANLLTAYTYAIYKTIPVWTNAAWWV